MLNDTFSEWARQTRTRAILATTLQSRVLTCTGLLWQILGVVKIKPVVCEGVTSPAGSDNISSLRITRSKRPRIPSDRWYSRGVTGDFILHGYSTPCAWKIKAVATGGTFEWNRSATCNSNFQSLETGFEAYFSHYAYQFCFKWFLVWNIWSIEIITGIVTKGYYFLFSVFIEKRLYKMQIGVAWWNINFKTPDIALTCSLLKIRYPVFRK